MRPTKVRVGKEFSLMPACCIHWPQTETDLLREFVNELQATPNAYTILMGDTFDLARTHYRSHIRKYRDDDNSQEALDDFARREVSDLAKILEPVKDRIWGVIRGNHWWEFADGTNSEQYLCQILGLKYLGVMGLIRVTCDVYKPKGSAPRAQNLTVFAHHSGGSMGGRTTGGSVNALTRQEATWDADIYLLGHDHRRLAWKEPVMSVTRTGEPRAVARDRVFARCGAFLKGFREDNPSATQRHTPTYAEEKALRPTDLGWVRINVKWRAKTTYAVKGGQRKRVNDLVYPEYRLEY